MINFSVVIPLYNKASHIRRTIDSIINQTINNFEIIVVNDGSTDNGSQIVESIEDERINLLHQENAGVSVARNRGVQEAKYPIIAFLDADDTWEPNFLQLIKELIQQFPNAGAYATSYRMIQSDSKVKGLKYYGLPSDNWVGLIPNFFKSICWANPLIWTGAICVPKKIFLELNGFTPGVQINEDYELWIKIALQYRVAYNTAVASNYYLNTENRVCYNNTIEEIPYKSILLNAIENGKISNEEIIFAKELLSRHSYTNAVRLLLVNQVQKARKMVLDVNSISMSLNIKKIIVLLMTYLPFNFIKPIAKIIWDIKYFEFKN